jgi:hypothetical protein
MIRVFNLIVISLTCHSLFGQMDFVQSGWYWQVWREDQFMDSVMYVNSYELGPFDAYRQVYFRTFLLQEPQQWQELKRISYDYDTQGRNVGYLVEHLFQNGPYAFTDINVVYTFDDHSRISVSTTNPIGLDYESDYKTWTNYSYDSLSRLIKLDDFIYYYHYHGGRQEGEVFFMYDEQDRVVIDSVTFSYGGGSLLPRYTNHYAYTNDLLIEKSYSASNPYASFSMVPKLNYHYLYDEQFRLDTIEIDSFDSQVWSTYQRQVYDYDAISSDLRYITTQQWDSVSSSWQNKYRFFYTDSMSTEILPFQRPIDFEKAEASMVVYPNPGSLFHLAFSKRLYQPLTFSIYQYDGKLIGTFTAMQDETVGIQNVMNSLDSGIYLIAVRSENFNETVKWIKNAD